MKVKVIEWDLETEDESGEIVVVSFADAGVQPNQIFDVDAANLAEALDIISDKTGWLIKSAKRIN